MIKKSIYPKTKRIGNNTSTIVITEKLDGSNLAFFKKDGIVHIATRNNILNLKEDREHFKKILYKGLQGWLDENLNSLVEDLYEGSVIIGEWIGMGKINYPDLDKRFYMFAKGNLDEDLTLKNINYTHDFFKYCFTKQEIPEYIGVVPIVYEISYIPTVTDLDNMYETYRKTINRDTEGFIVCQANNILKYVRMKDGKFQPHKS